jgi:hypothetical protein
MFWRTRDVGGEEASLALQGGRGRRYMNIDEVLDLKWAQQWDDKTLRPGY